MFWCVLREASVLVIELLRCARGETDLLLCGGAAKVLLLLLRFIAATIYG
jgi:hypothetical protein